MRTAAVAFGVVLMAINGRSNEIACDRAFVLQSWDLLKLAGYGQSSYEHAAFVICDSAANVRFVMWPFYHQSYEATYAGATPPNTIAIIHTHPNSLPVPSVEDAEVARRTRLPVYVVTRTMISRTTGHYFEIVLEGDWNPGRGFASSHCRATSIVQVQ